MYFIFCPKTKYKKKWETLFGNPTFKILYRTVVAKNTSLRKNFKKRNWIYQKAFYICSRLDKYVEAIANECANFVCQSLRISRAVAPITIENGSLENFRP